MHDKIRNYPECPNNASIVIAHELHYSYEKNFIRDQVPSGVPVIAHFHLKWNFLGDPAQPNVKAAFDTMKITDGIVPAEFARETLPTWVPQTIRWHVVHYGLDTTIFRPSEVTARRSWRNRLGLDENAFVGLWTVNFDPAKGRAIIRELLPLLKRNNIYLAVEYQRERINPEVLARLESWKEIAEGYLIDMVKGEAERRVVVCDCTLHTSYSEQAPLVVIESLLSGVPVVATPSTKFYNEVHKLGIPETVLRTTSLRPEYDNYQWSANGKEVQKCPAKAIAEEFVENLRSLTIYSDEQREMLAQRARPHFSELPMLHSFKRIYDMAERKATD